MRIAWFTPFTKNSAVGKYSQSITERLSGNCEVDIWSAESDNLLSTKLNVLHYHPSENLEDRLKKYDFIIYNIGDSIIFHKAIYEASKKFKGIVILHDLVMHHFFAHYYIIDKDDAHAYINEMAILYGMKGWNAAIDSISKRCIPIWERNEVVDYPFFEKIIENTIGVIVHSKYHADRVKPKFLGPIDVIYHPFYSYDNSVHNTTKSDLGLPPGKVIVVSVGHVNPNKRIDKVIEVLGGDKELAKTILYIVIGPYEEGSPYISRIRSIVKKYGLEDTVKFLGFQSEEKLHDYMSNANIFINLRLPPMEGASGSLVEELYFGKPVIVTNTGFYSELPDDCVIKVDPLNEEEEFRRALKKLINDNHAREEIGKRGQSFAFKNFNTNRYCRSFFKFLNDVQYSKPIFDLTDKVGEELYLMGASDNISAVDIAAKEIYEIFRR